ncbi:serine protease [Streptomyces sp. NPDC088197]|uniref:serine protease n=1 Tax=Streptomyces sp. NPDC088197 TaxID=3365840 RepID=UPI00380F49AF
MAVRGADVDDALVRVCDLAGRPRGTGFLADADGTMVTSHEAVDGLARLVLHAPGDQVCLVEVEAITVLPEAGLALVATEGLNLPPLPIAPRGPAHPERRVRLKVPQWTDGVVLGTASVTYTATDRFHLLEEVYELGLGATDMSRVAPQSSGAPLIDAATGAVLAVAVTALHAGHRAAGFAVPLRAGPGTPEPLAALLARNAATVPAYGPHLNLAGALQLTGTSVGSAAGPGQWREPVARPEVADALRDFLAPRGETAPLVLGLVGDPGSGRSTELAALAARRARGAEPAPTVWLRGAELRPGDGGIKDAVERSLRTAARIVCAAAGRGGAVGGDPPFASPDAVAALARTAGRPLLVLLDAPEEMPPVLAHALADWTAGTASWLRAGGVRLIVGCRPEFWEQAGSLLPAGMAYAPPPAPYVAVRALPPCLRLGDLTDVQAVRARTRHGLAPDALRPADAAHPLALRLLSEIQASLPGGTATDGAAPTRAEIFAAHLDLVCLRIAVRLAASAERPVRGNGVRRLATRVAGQVHEAARRCLGPGQGELDRESFEDLFPWRMGWASAVLTEGLLVPAGAGYRFAHEEVADWLQGLHLDLDAALHALVHRWFAAPAGGTEAPVRLPQRPAAVHAGEPPVPPAPAVAPPSGPRSLPVPRHRLGPVLQAMLATDPDTLTRHLRHLIHRLDHQAIAPTRHVSAPDPDPAAPPRRPAPVRRPAWDACTDAYLDTETVPNPRSRRRPRPTPAGPCQGGGGGGGEGVPDGGTGGGVGGGPVGLLAGRAGAPGGGAGVVPAGGAGGGAGVSGGGPAGWSVACGGWPSGGGGTGGAGAGVGGQRASGGGPATVGSGQRLDGGDSAPGRGPCGGPDEGGGAATGGAPWGHSSCEGGGPSYASGPRARRGDGVSARRGDAVWWAAHLVGEVLTRLGDARNYRGVLRLLAERVAVRSVERGGFTPEGLGGLGEFGPAFWRRVPLPLGERLELLRLLLPADRPPVPGEPADPETRFLPAVAELLREAPAEALAAVCGWFDDDRPLQTAPGADGPRLTVASAAQALLHTHRRLAVDELTEALVAAGHPGADEVLAALAEDEPSAVCRAVDRWAHDPRPDRHVAAASYGRRAAAFVRSEADRELLRYAALAILARPGDCTLHGAALGLLVRDSVTRSRHLDAALRHFAAGDPHLPAGALAAALGTHPEPVLAAFQTRLRAPYPDGGAAEVLDELAGVTSPALARRAAALAQDHLLHHPDGAADVARFLDRRLEQGPGVRAVLLPLAAALMTDHPPDVRRALLPVFAAPGTHLSRPLRQELLDMVLAAERDPGVLDALLAAAADGCHRRPTVLTRDLVHRVGLLLGRTPEGAAQFDRRVVELAASWPDFGRLVREWLKTGGTWDAVIGPSARRRLEAAA